MCHACQFLMTLIKLSHNDRYMIHGRMTDNFSMVRKDSTVANNHESTLGMI